MTEAYTKSESVTLIDVRSASEQEKSPVKGAISIPFQLSPGSGCLHCENHFSWALTNKQLDEAKWDVPKGLEVLRASDSNRCVVVFGSSADDGRPVFLMREFLKLGIFNACWFRGAPDLIKAQVR